MEPGTVNYQGYTREVALRSVGPGWAGLVNEMFDNLPEGIKVVQVKEKLGRLVIYTDIPNVDVTARVRSLHTRSGHTCESCGLEAELGGNDILLRSVLDVMPLHVDEDAKNEAAQNESRRRPSAEEVASLNRVVKTATNGPLRTYCNGCETIFQGTGQQPWL